MRWYLRGCPACGGDLCDEVDSKGWVVCFLCGRSFRLAELAVNRTDERLELVTAVAGQSEVRDEPKPVAA